MKTLNLQGAAAFLNMSPEVLRQKAKAGDVPGAKPGKSWVFLEDDLAEYIRSQYARPRQAVRVTSEEEVAVCHSTAEVRPGGSVSPRPMVDEYSKALGLKTA